VCLEEMCNTRGSSFYAVTRYNSIASQMIDIMRSSPLLRRTLLPVDLLVQIPVLCLFSREHSELSATTPDPSRGILK
jgi:hypothetical protein